MPRYLVTWEIDMETSSPLEAAKEALEIMRDPESTALFFKIDDFEKQETIDIDLWEEGIKERGLL